MRIKRYILLFILFLLGRHLSFPSSPGYLELADSADYFIAHENWIRAEKALIDAMRLEPANFSNSMLLSNLGMVQTQLGNYQKAIESLSMGLSLAPSSTVLLNNRAHTYLLIDSINPAIADLDRSLRIDSIQEWTLKTRGYLYLQQGELAQAKKLFSKIQSHFPDNSSVWSGFAAIAESEGDTESAKEYYKKALTINPDDEEAREAYIFLLINLKEYSQARLAIKEGINKNPENPMYYLLRGYLHRLNYRLDEAQADKKLAIAKGLEQNYVSGFIP